MGTAHILIYPDAANKLTTYPDVKILEQSSFGDGMLMCLVESSMLDGYCGQMFAVFDGDDLSFKRDDDV